MRRRAQEVSLSRADERLPLPAARDEIRRLGETLDEMLDRVGRSFERERRFVADADDGQSVYADELRLRQALGNLVDNALRYGRGEIVLRSRRAGRGQELEVSDQDKGFAPEFAERAFERFARGDLARTRDGTGLGLSIVRAIAEAHGGRAVVVPGAGATVRLWLPDRPGTTSGSSQIPGVVSRSQALNPTRGGETR